MFYELLVSLSYKKNKALQQRLLNLKFIYIVKTISLVPTIFWNSVFLLYTRHSPNLIKQFRLTIKIWKLIYL